MFGYAAGLLLPCSSTSDQLLQRPEVLKLVADELRQQLGSVPSAQLVVWGVCADGRSPSPALSATLLGAWRPAHVLGEGSESIATEVLELWIRHSQVVIHLRLADPHGDDALEQGWLRQRLRGSRPQWRTTDLLIEPGADRCGHQHRYCGEELLAADARPRPVLLVLHEQLTPQPGEIDPLAPEPRAWLLRRGSSARRRSNQRLWRQACLLAVLVVVVRGAIPAFPPTLVLLLAGTWWMSRQPWRERSQQWWCLQQLLWVQDSWHRFGLRDCPAERPHQSSEPPRGEPMLDLNEALRSHAIWLWTQPAPAAWGRPQLTDCLQFIADHRQALRDLERRQRQRQQLVRLLLALAAALVLVSLFINTSLLVEQLVLVVLVVVIGIGLASPTPLLPIDVLLQQQSRLQDELTDLERGQRAETLSDPKLRASVEAALRRIGVALVDLCDDALLAARDRRRWLP